jgi:hypothetical protein
MSLRLLDTVPAIDVDEIKLHALAFVQGSELSVVGDDLGIVNEDIGATGLSPDEAKALADIEPQDLTKHIKPSTQVS